MDTLPIEILDAVIGWVDNVQDLKRLCEVSRRVYGVALPKLYETVIIRADDESHLERLDVEPYLRRSSNLVDRLQFIRNVCIVAEFHFRLGLTRCPHMEDDETLYGGDVTPMRPFSFQEYDFCDLAHRLMPFFERLKDNNLLSFHWELGTCVPQEILGPSGYLLQKQKRIESLSLITGSSCEANIEGRCPIVLSEFNRLQKLSWKAILSVEDFQGLQQALKANSAHLRNLELDLLDWSDASYCWQMNCPSLPRLTNFFASGILNVSPGSERILLPALRVFSASALSFRSAPMEMASAFNFSGLCSLKLRTCPGAASLLKAIVDASLAMKLTSFELTINEQEWRRGDDDPIRRFLGSFHGLEELSMLIWDSQRLIRNVAWDCIRFHEQTLKRLVYGERYRNHRGIDYYVFEQSDDTENMDEREFEGRNLEYIGLWVAPDAMKLKIAQLGAEKTIKLLHIRESGQQLLTRYLVSQTVLTSPPLPPVGGYPEGGEANANEDQSETLCRKPCLPGLAKFAQWAFGPEGYPKLQIIACGDFSYQGRYDRHNFLFCRKETCASLSSTPPSHEEPTGAAPDGSRWTFRIMTRKDEEELLDGSNGLKDAREFLAACPSEPLSYEVTDIERICRIWEQRSHVYKYRHDLVA